MSWLTSAEGFTVSQEGVLLSEKSVTFEGEIKRPGVASMIPQEFYPVTAIALRQQFTEVIKLFQEKIYIQTDKPYYYPGEVVWFKGYVNYFEKEMADSLSRVMYLELIDPARKIVLTKIMKIDSGRTWGDIILPDSMKEGNYQMRAYTNAMRNFSTQNFFDKVFPILKPTEKAVAKNDEEPPGNTKGFSISTDKPVYKQREKISLSFSVVDENNDPVYSDISVAVTDAGQVAPAQEAVSITKNYNFDDQVQGSIPKIFKYPIERGISFTGNIINDKRRPEAGTIVMMRGGVDNLVSFKTNENGLFRLAGYQFYDSSSFSFQGQNKNGKVSGKVELQPHDVPAVADIDTAVALEIIPTRFRQRTISEYEVPSAVKVLQEINVTAKKTKASEFVTSTFGRNPRIYPGNVLKGNDMLEALVLAVPGLKLTSGSGGDMGRYLTFAFSGKTEPLIYLNNFYIGGGQGQSAVNALRPLIPANVDHIEVINNASPNFMINFYGGLGMINIFMKPGTSDAGFIRKTVQGYSRPRPFRSPEYDAKDTQSTVHDWRSTIYWNPNLIIKPVAGQTSVSFFAADLPGRYHVVAEGVTADGDPIRSELYFEVKEGL